MEREALQPGEVAERRRNLAAELVVVEVEVTGPPLTRWALPRLSPVAFAPRRH